MGKNRIEQTFHVILERNEKLFIPYIMAGDGGLDGLAERVQFLEECGASAIEIGIPFSDPTADGPTIQLAGIRSLANGTTLAQVLNRLEKFKDRRSIPIILMTYLNPVYRYGIEKFAADCVKVGVDGIIIPDVPLEEEDMIARHLGEKGIAHIQLVALTSPEERAKKIAQRSEGFLYAVSVMGTTGARNHHDEHVKEYLQKLKKISPVPVLAGFGVSNAEQAKTLSSYCDGVIVGSKIVELFHEGRSEEIKNLIQKSTLVNMNA